MRTAELITKINTPTPIRQRFGVLLDSHNLTLLFCWPCYVGDNVHPTPIGSGATYNVCWISGLAVSFLTQVAEVIELIGHSTLRIDEDAEP